ncbi:hypothetical protein KZ294_27245, partial [Escherichia coli]|nr:hypothetical protein [Escherichia coli]
GGPAAVGDEFGETTGGAHATVADEFEMPVREAPSDGGTGEMDQDVDALEEVSGGIAGVPVALPRATGVAADEADGPGSGARV